MTSARPDHLLISGTFNYRDVGGLRTASGAKVRSGVLLRSAHLCRLDADGHATLRELGVATVHDLRGPREIDYLGQDALPREVRLELSPFDSQIGEKPPHEVVYDDGRSEMLQVYAAFPAMPEAGVALVTIAESLVRGDGAVLVHCAAGKDRTGWAVATLLRAVGVTESEVLDDYLLSNGAIDALCEDVAINSDGKVTLPEAVLGVFPEYLAAATESMHTIYGDLDGYLDAIGLTDPLRGRLRERLLE
ncbi:tyrosine-protein phosphatase [Nocardia sp. CDC159]|uniref:Tyrosine-protein phosphatase n=1 Tax=Nocardia pulmonis TaxID=2951408 RepID=A0A9X2EAD2_9NOCA|nr:MULTISPECIES: tyrosine-protein phosphatase [Nocardia]MCM6775800.1 tyrosine-protein phosphatase [Nocardia pulmonis]MCM6788224.1 tyrosine-protein phosphatase [Nocardia sp. CDC159]